MQLWANIIKDIQKNEKNIKKGENLFHRFIFI
jgi:hypothetical protein